MNDKNRKFPKWFPCCYHHPEHGREVLTYRSDRGKQLLGWWDKEINGWIVYDANGTKQDRPDYWTNPPENPAGVRPSPCPRRGAADDAKGGG